MLWLIIAIISLVHLYFAVRYPTLLDWFAYCCRNPAPSSDKKEKKGKRIGVHHAFTHDPANWPIFRPTSSHVPARARCVDTKTIFLNTPDKLLPNAVVNKILVEEYTPAMNDGEGYMWHTVLMEDVTYRVSSKTLTEHLVKHGQPVPRALVQWVPEGECILLSDALLAPMSTFKPEKEEEKEEETKN